MRDRMAPQVLGDFKAKKVTLDRLDLPATGTPRLKRATPVQRRLRVFIPSGRTRAPAVDTRLRETSARRCRFYR